MVTRPLSLWEGGVWTRDYSAYGMKRRKLQKTQCKLNKRKLVNQCFVTYLIAIETKQPQQAEGISYYGLQLLWLTNLWFSLFSVQLACTIHKIFNSFISWFVLESQTRREDGGVEHSWFREGSVTGRLMADTLQDSCWHRMHKQCTIPMI